MNIHAFIGELLRDWQERDYADIDGGDLEELCVKHGLSTKRPATEEDCKEEWAMYLDVEPGDPVNVWEPEIKTMIQATD